MDQRGLVERARRGDHDAFTELAHGAVTRLDPSGRTIEDTGRGYLLDPVGGPWKTVPWSSNGDLDWQRLALD